jgi:hypothetical protein
MVASAAPCTLARWVRSFASRMKHLVQPGKLHLQGEEGHRQQPW